MSEPIHNDITDHIKEKKHQTRQSLRVYKHDDFIDFLTQLNGFEDALHKISQHGTDLIITNLNKKRLETHHYYWCQINTKQIDLHQQYPEKHHRLTLNLETNVISFNNKVVHRDYNEKLQMGITNKGIKTSLNNLFYCGKNVIPALNLEGDFLTGLAVANSASKQL